MSYKYYQPNKYDLKDEFGDCQIRALSKALNVTWEQAFDINAYFAKKNHVMCVWDCKSKKRAEIFHGMGFEYGKIPKSTSITVKQFCKAHPNDVCICTVRHHVVACVHGDYFDTWDSGNEYVCSYFTLIDCDKALHVPTINY